MSLLSSRPVQPTSSSTSVKTRSGSPLCRPPTQAPPPQPSWPMTSSPAEMGAQKQVQQRPTSPWKRTELVFLWVRTCLLLPLCWCPGWCQHCPLLVNARLCWAENAAARFLLLLSVTTSRLKHQLVFSQSSSQGGDSFLLFCLEIDSKLLRVSRKRFIKLQEIVPTAFLFISWTEQTWMVSLLAEIEGVPAERTGHVFLGGDLPWLR